MIEEPFPGAGEVFEILGPAPRFLGKALVLWDRAHWNCPGPMLGSHEFMLVHWLTSELGGGDQLKLLKTVRASFRRSRVAGGLSPGN